MQATLMNQIKSKHALFVLNPFSSVGDIIDDKNHFMVEVKHVKQFQGFQLAQLIISFTHLKFS